MKRSFAIFVFFVIVLSSVAGYAHPKDELEAEIHKKYGITVSSDSALSMAGYLFFLKEFLKAAEKEGLGKRYFPHAKLHQIHVYPEDKVTTTTISGNFIKTNYRLAEEAVLFLKGAFPLQASMEATLLSVKNQAIRKAIMDKIAIIKDTYKIDLLLPSAFEGQSSINEKKRSFSEEVNMETIAYEYQNQLLEGLVQLIAELEAGNELRKTIYLPRYNDYSYDPLGDALERYRFNWNHRSASTEVIDEYMLKISEELGYVVPKPLKDGTTEYLVLPSLVTIETVDGTLSNALELSVMKEKWITISPWYQLVHINMLKNFFELKLAEALKTNKKVRIKRNGWKSPFEILAIEDEPSFEACPYYMEHGVELDPEKARFEIFPGKISATCVGFYYDNTWIASECYNFQSSAQKIKEILDHNLNFAKVTKETFRYFPVTLLEENLTFEESFIFSNQSLPGPLEGMNFVFIPAGTFEMGSPPDEEGRDDNETLHTVTLNLDFEMMTTEVTQKQWEEVMGSNPSYFKGEDLPVENVSWDDAKAFADKMNERNDGWTYRLPTEAEWEYAARGGGKTAYSFGDNPALLKEHGWFEENSQKTTHPVASCPTKEKAKPNRLGLYDMHGNVWEWVSDWYKEEYPTGAVTDPTGSTTGFKRVIRGGSYYGFACYCRSAIRCGLGTDFRDGRDGRVGFRLVRVRQESAKSQWTFQLGDKPYLRTTTTGAIFTRDTSHPALGEAWRDPDGLIWGDIVKNEDGSVRKMVQSSKYMKKIGRPLPEGTLGAEEYCESIDARLPSKEEFIRLREYMGDPSGTYEGYSHHNNKILPNLSGNWFWSSWVGPNGTDDDYAYGFNGSNGIIDYDNRNYSFSVRCVVGR